MSQIYVASSWRNERQPWVVHLLQANGHQVYDFRHPDPRDSGFHWSEIDRNWQHWEPEEYRSALDHPIAESGFGKDWAAMQWADCCVLVLPCGRSAHLEAGYFVGAGKSLYILLDEIAEPELMYKMATAVLLDTEALLTLLASSVAQGGQS